MKAILIGHTAAAIIRGVSPQLGVEVFDAMARISLGESATRPPSLAIATWQTLLEEAKHLKGIQVRCSRARKKAEQGSIIQASKAEQDGITPVSKAEQDGITPVSKSEQDGITPVSKAEQDGIISVSKHIQEEEEEKEKEKEREPRARKRAAAFAAPSLEDVKARIAEMGYDVSAEAFWNFYESKNWYVGKNKMTDWKRALAGWQARERSGGATPRGAAPNNLGPILEAYDGHA